MGLLRKNQSTFVMAESNPRATPLEIHKSPGEWLDDLDAFSSQTRRRAAAALAGHSEYMPKLVGCLIRESDRSVRAVLFSTLMQTPGDQTANLLVSLLRSEDANLRNESIEALSAMPDHIEPIMEDMLHDLDSDVRIFAVNILASVKHPKVVDWLIDIVSNDRELNVCATAVDLMAEVGDERCLPALEQAQERFTDEPYLEFVVELAQSRIGKNNANSPIRH